MSGLHPVFAAIRSRLVSRQGAALRMKIRLAVETCDMPEHPALLGSAGATSRDQADKRQDRKGCNNRFFHGNRQRVFLDVSKDTKS